MIKVETLKLLPNYVLILPDEDYETYQLSGRETGIRSALSTGTAGQRISLYGTVIKVPEKLRYSGAELRSVRSNYNPDHVQSIIDNIKKGSVNYDVDMELKLGDRVMYVYKNQIDAYKDARVLYTDKGTCMLMKYDTIKCKHIGDDEVYPLNGSVFIKPLTLAEEEKTKGGIIKIEKTHMGMKVKAKLAIGVVSESGCICNGYLEFASAGADGSREKLEQARDMPELNPGTYVYYDARMCTNLEFENHQTLPTARKVIWRKDIYGIITDPTKFDFLN